MELLPHLEMAEIRLDRCPLSDDEAEALFNLTDVPLIATCRMAEEKDAPAILERAIEAGAKYADLEMEAPAAVGRRIKEACHRCGTTLIRSFHGDVVSPREIYDRAILYGADIVKIVQTTKNPQNATRLMELYKEVPKGTLVAFSMEESDTRIAALKSGAPFSYASLDRETATAPGQIPHDEMEAAVYGGFHFINGECDRLPSSKSFAQRAIIAAALASGISRLEKYSPCDDSENAIAFAKALGAKVKRDSDVLEIEGVSAKEGCLEGLKEVNVGESGLLTRLAIPLLAALSKGPVDVTGSKSILSRPLSDAHNIMASYGARLYPKGGMPTSPDVASARQADCYLPLTVSGPLYPGRADISGKGGSQLISGLLYALPLCEGRSQMYVSEPKSIPYLFITTDILKKFGIRINSEIEGGEEFLESGNWDLCTSVNFSFRGGQGFKAASFPIEADWSGAAPLLVAGALFGGMELHGLDSKSLQADISILDILVDAGASISEGEDGSIRVRRAPLNPFETDLNNCPDLFPVVAVLAAFCPGTSHIRGVNRLRFKETDRAAAILQTLTRMGVQASADDDVMTVEGIGLTERILTGKLLKGGEYTAFGDHRMAMALSLASLGADSPVVADNPACVAKSFPTFNDIWNKLTQ